MEKNLKYPVGIQDFEKLRELGYVYADKTPYIRLMTEQPKLYFLSRPRRFGKSPFLSTLQAYFEGKRDLFKGLDIDSDDMDWTPRPVIKFSLNALDPKSEMSLINYIGDALRYYENKYGITDSDKEISSRFENLIRTACETTGRKVVVLVDEYDAPLLSTLEKKTLNNSYRETLKAFFSVLKNADSYIHFVFITGVSRFSHTSLFRGANNLMDISLLPEYSSICGVSEDELEDVLKPGIQDFAESKGMSYDEMLSVLKENYDGYHFSRKSPDVYNPYSLLYALQTKNIDNYWFQSGTPTYLLKALKRDNFYLPNLDCIETLAGGLSTRESFLNNPVSLMYETGYLTIREYDEESMTYILSLPNKEVSQSFSEALIPIYSGYDEMKSNESFSKMHKAVVKGEAEEFMQHLKTFLAGNPYSNTELGKRETYFKNNIYLIFKALGFMPRVEEETCRSRMGVMLRTRRFIYIFELKTDGDADKAMKQIDDKEYALPYVDEGKTIIKIAANYSSKVNNIDSWEIK